MVNTKKPSKNARKSWMFPAEAAMPCKKGTKKHSGLQATEAKSEESNKIPKTEHACIVEAHESTRKRLESCLPRQRIQFHDSSQFGTQIHSNASNDANSGCEISSGEGTQEARNNSSLAVGQSKEQLVPADVVAPSVPCCAGSGGRFLRVLGFLPHSWLVQFSSFVVVPTA